MTRLLRWLDHLPNWLRAGVVTGFWAAALPFVAAATSWLEDFFQWASGEPGVHFPDISVLRSATVGLASGAFIGGANAIFRYVQQRRGSGNPPAYPDKASRRGDRGQVSPGTAILLLVAVLLVIVVLRGTGTC